MKEKKLYPVDVDYGDGSMILSKDTNGKINHEAQYFVAEKRKDGTYKKLSPSWDYSKFEVGFNLFPHLLSDPNTKMIRVLKIVTQPEYILQEYTREEAEDIAREAKRRHTYGLIIKGIQEAISSVRDNDSLEKAYAVYDKAIELGFDWTVKFEGARGDRLFMLCLRAAKIMLGKAKPITKKVMAKYDVPELPDDFMRMLEER